MPHLIQEILDTIVDHLCDDREVLKQWLGHSHTMPEPIFLAPSNSSSIKTFRSGRKLFHDLNILPCGIPVTSMFINHESLPNCYHHHRRRRRGPLGSSFCRVVELKVWISREDPSFWTTFHWFQTPLLKYSGPILCSRVFDLICALTALDGFLATTDFRIDDDNTTVLEPSTSPLVDWVPRYEEHFAQTTRYARGIHFRHLMCTCAHNEDFSWTTALIERCSNTLERRARMVHPARYRRMSSIDLSKATKLKKNWHSGLAKKNLITPFDSRHIEPAVEEAREHCKDLDRALVRTRKSHKVSTRIMTRRMTEGYVDALRDCCRSQRRSRSEKAFGGPQNLFGGIRFDDTYGPASDSSRIY